MKFVRQYLDEVVRVTEGLDRQAIERLVRLLADVRDRGGRLFVLGVGGGAAHASHAVDDFRKIAGIEACAATDNASELTARINNDGWDTSFAQWLGGSHLRANDAVVVFSVGGGSLERGVSTNIVRDLELAKSVGARVCRIVGRDGGFTARVTDACVVVPTVNPAIVTAHTKPFRP